MSPNVEDLYSLSQSDSSYQLKSRHCFLSRVGVQPANLPAKVIWCSEWRKGLSNKRTYVSLHERLQQSMGHVEMPQPSAHRIHFLKLPPLVFVLCDISVSTMFVYWVTLGMSSVSTMSVYCVTLDMSSVSTMSVYWVTLGMSSVSTMSVYWVTLGMSSVSTVSVHWVTLGMSSVSTCLFTE